MTQDVNSFLMGGGARSAKFEDEGTVVVGYITHSEVRQQTDLKSGAPLTWENGDPRMQLIITLETESRDDDDDDGLRTLYVRGQMQKAVSEAVRKSGERGITNGGKLGVKFVSTAAPKTKGFNGAKQYTAKYVPPVTQVDSFDDEPAVDPF